MPFVETMTGRERVMNALAGKPVDRPPVCNPTNVATVDALLSTTSWALNPVFCQVAWKCRLISNAHI